MSEDRELKAMGIILAAMDPLDAEEKKRVLSWLAQKLSVAVPNGRVPLLRTPQESSLGEPNALSTNTIATIIGANSGPDLIIAAAAHLHFSQSKSTFTRRELTAQMRAAPSHYKGTFLNNLTSYLNGLTRTDRLRLSGPDTYALSIKERQDLEVKLANAQ